MRATWWARAEVWIAEGLWAVTASVDHTNDDATSMAVYCHTTPGRFGFPMRASLTLPSWKQSNCTKSPGSQHRDAGGCRCATPDRGTLRVQPVPVQ